MEKNDFWIFNYQPTFNNLLIPNENYINLKKIIEDKNIDNHIIIYGGRGNGKNMLAKCIINHCCDVSFSSLRNHRDLINVKHLDRIYYINLDIYNNNNICDLIFECANKSRFDREYKILIINNLDRLSNLNQIKFSYFMEKKYKNFRLVGITSNINKINNKICKQCYNHRLPSIPIKKFKNFMIKLAKNNNIKFTDCQIKKAKEIYKNNQFNLKKSLLMIQYMIESKTRDVVPINVKLVHKLLNFTCGKGYINLQNAKDYIFILIGLGLSVSDIIKICISEILKIKNLDISKKLKIIAVASDLQSKSNQMDRSILILDNFLIQLNQIFID